MQPTLKHLGQVAYMPTWQAMQDFTAARTATTADEIWVLEHPPVYTLGRNADPNHILNAHDIPLIQIDRGGQVTYHGPGQIVVYPLLNIERRGMHVRNLVSWLENAVIATLQDYAITAAADPAAPGVYVDGAKIAAVGLRVSKNACYHGLSFNLNMDLSPFSNINPCGFAGLRVTQLVDQFVMNQSVNIATFTIQPVIASLLQHLLATLPAAHEN